MDPQIPSPAADFNFNFNFDSTSTSPFTTAPSSPKILFPSTNSHHLPPINHENYESTHHDFQEPDHTDFAFDFSGQLEPPSISDADELFDSGRIKPLQPPPQAPTSHDRKMKLNNPSSRGRGTTVPATGHKTSRSLSPMRASDQKVSVSVSTNQSSQLFGFTWYNKWNLKNLLLFRSTSEGSATRSEDGSISSLKYAMITKGDGDAKSSSFRSCDGGGGSVGGSSRRMKRKVSAHELHYTANRAVAEEMRRKTFLPYRSGLLGCLGFGHNVHESCRGR